MDSDSIAWEEVSGEYGARIEPFTSLFCEPLLEEASDALGRPLAEVALLDVGCGTGALALAAAARGAHVTATDVAAGMVERTRRRAEAAGLSVRTLVADGCCLPLEHAGVFQLALSNFGAIFFRPPHAGIDEMLRCLRPGGIIGLTAWGGPKETEAFQIIPCVARSLFGDDFIGADVPEKGRMSGSPEALSAMLSSVGLEPHITGPVTRHLRCGNAIAFWHRFALASPGTRRMLARLSANQREALQAAVVSILEQRFGGGEIMLPASAYLAIGRARPILGPVHVGTAGFAGISGHWAGKGVFMPGTKNARGDAALDFYQEKFDAVEINGTAYAMPSASTISSWRAHSARNFCICPKAVSAFTHANDPSSAAALDALRTFLERVLALGPHLGPVLLQFSRSVKADRSLLDGIAATVHQVEKSTTVLGVQRSQSLETTASQDHEGNGNSQTLVVSEGSRLREGVSVQGSECMPHRGNVHPRLQLAIEFRHASWLTQGFALADYFQTRGWALVVHPNSLGRATTQVRCLAPTFPRSRRDGNPKSRPFARLASSYLFSLSDLPLFVARPVFAARGALWRPRALRH